MSERKPANFEIRRSEEGRKHRGLTGGRDELHWWRYAETAEAAVLDIATGMNEPVEHFIAEPYPRAKDTLNPQDGKDSGQ